MVVDKSYMWIDWGIGGVLTRGLVGDVVKSEIECTHSSSFSHLEISFIARESG